MPYIEKKWRAAIDPEGGFRSPVSAGELNYIITRLIVEYVQVLGLKYQTINDAIGALEGVKQEFIRRIVNPYEQHKLETNGDVYGPLIDLLPNRANVRVATVQLPGVSKCSDDLTG